MQSEPILDLARLDLTRVLHSKEAILRVLPHRGPMALLDGVVHLDAGSRTLVGFKDARDDEFWVEGHFPGNPLLPGVVQIEAAAQLAVFAYKTFLPEVRDRLIVFGAADDFRFRGAVRPGQRLWLVGRAVEMNRRMARCAAQGFVDGKRVFDGTVTGVPV